MILCVGLGNPGQQYLMNRHNIGFMAIDSFASEYNFPVFKRKFHGEISESKIDSNLVILLKPQTYMNLSGSSVQSTMDFYKIALEKVIVFHDDLDLIPGQIKVKQGGGAAGHNGLRSLDKMIGNNYWRVRIGIGHPGDRSMVSNYVLSPFQKSDHEWLAILLQKLSSEFSHLTVENPHIWSKRLIS